LDSDQPNTRYFQLQIRSTCQLNCSYCPGLGLVAAKDRIHQDLLQSLKKAQSGDYSAAAIPCNALDFDDLPIVVETIRSHNLQPILQINSRQLLNMKTTIDSILGLGVGVQVLLGNNTSMPDAIWTNLKQKSELFFVTIIAHKRMHALEAFRSLPDWVKRSAYFLFPYQMDEADEFFTPENIYEFLKRFRVQFPGYKVSPSPGIDIYDRLTPAGVDLELEMRPFFSSQAALASTQPPLYSVIIPTHDDRTHLLGTLQSLSHQTLGLDQFEVIVVDESSQDDTLVSVVEALKSDLQNLRAKIIRLSFGSAKDKKPSAQSLALNLGVKNAIGEHLLFFSSHTVATPNLLEQLLIDHEKGDLVQARRMLLPSDFEMDPVLKLDETSLKTYGVAENHFWSQFYKASHQWNQLADGWRYISGSQLSIRRDVFENVGWFRKSYSLAGFEDCEFAYRARKKGFQFFLSDAQVYQKTAGKEVSSLLNWHRHRQQQQAKSAQVFFQNNLDTEVYEHLQSFL
jgi:GT2 family glycosyltransferase